MEKKEWLTVQELAAQHRMSLKSNQRTYRKEEISLNWFLCSLVVALGYI
jgi:hypothetical protein